MEIKDSALRLQKSETKGYTESSLLNEDYLRLPDYLITYLLN